MINKRLFESHKVSMETNSIIKEGLENTYKDYSKANGMLGMNEFLRGTQRKLL